MPHSAVSQGQRARAKDLRQRMTRAETLLWRYIKGHHLDGLAFRRQAPMGSYIVDFVCHAASLVIELDGESHDFQSRLERDRVRDAWLKSRGYIVLRFTNEQVLGSLEGVLLTIHQMAIDRMQDTPPCLPLPRKGGGNRPEQASRYTFSHVAVKREADASPAVRNPATPREESK